MSKKLPPEERLRKIVERTRQWRKKNRERHLEQSREQSRRKRARNPEKEREYNRTYIRNYKRARPHKYAQYNYKLSEEEAKRLFALVECGPCELCGTAGRVYFDHDHSTGKFRGLLCAACNQGLGRFRDNPELLQLAINYLRERS